MIEYNIFGGLNNTDDTERAEQDKNLYSGPYEELIQVGYKKENRSYYYLKTINQNQYEQIKSDPYIDIKLVDDLMIYFKIENPLFDATKFSDVLLSEADKENPATQYC